VLTACCSDDEVLWVNNNDDIFAVVRSIGLECQCNKRECMHATLKLVAFVVQLRHRSHRRFCLRHRPFFEFSPRPLLLNFESEVKEEDDDGIFITDDVPTGRSQEPSGAGKTPAIPWELCMYVTRLWRYWINVGFEDGNI
jgi:hypothetical protein